jgi:hypothetical protein
MKKDKGYLDNRRQCGDMIQVFKLIHKIDEFHYEKLYKFSDLLQIMKSEDIFIGLKS